MDRKRGGLAVIGLVLAQVACGGSTGPSPLVGEVATTASLVEGSATADGYGPGAPLGAGLPSTGPGPGDGLCGLACTEPALPGPADLQEVLGRAIQEEYKARMLYLSVLEDFGDGALPFARVASSEATHVAAVAGLLERRGWAVPASVWSPASFPAFATLAAACEAGVIAETEDAASYDPYLARTDLPRDVVNVFTNLRAASLEAHLPAFQTCR